MKSLRVRLLLAATLWAAGTVSCAAAVLALALREHVQSQHPWIGASLAVSLFLAGGALLCAGVICAVRGFRPLATLRSVSGQIRRGAAREITGEYPIEVEPLIADLNALLAQQWDDLARSRAQAASLAHGLKTPLSVMSNEINALRSTGRRVSAEMLAQSVALMRSQVERHLARSRAAASVSFAAPCDVSHALERLQRTMQAMYRHRHLKIDLHCRDASRFRGDSADFEEMVGNLADNACKFARSAVIMSARSEKGTLIVEIEDDGPGFAEEAQEGVGLSIVRELTQLYGGKLERAGPTSRLLLPSA